MIFFGLMCVVVTVRLRALKAKIAAHKKELEELDKNVYVSRPLSVRTKFLRKRLLVSNSSDREDQLNEGNPKVE